ncbi:lipase [Pleomassaria siparia CBS 279.74]|uniref:Lipase n=1 Tax=Pleomassaria siparia CBS 279.74 TaxID=1314801 RepID=A0A6G1KLC0_9PLEO|nr:lipase [Pleomassaria siparia CBS 279.74]
MARLLSSPIPPSSDPFYTAPPNLESSPPGTILRQRPAPGNLNSIIHNSSSAYNILYRTTDSNYQPSWAVTTLILPLTNLTHYTNHSTSSLLSLQVPYNSADVDASPSYALYASLSTPSGAIPSTSDDIATALGNGWYVSVPDFEGPFASFGFGVQEGHATLDSVRAVLSSGLVSDAEKKKKKKKSKIAMWGYSGGSIASEWAAELQEQYAPELVFSGLALGGMVPNVTSALDNITASPYAGLIPELILGMTSQDPEARDYLVSRLHTTGTYNASYFLSALEMDIGEAFVAFAMHDIYAYFLGGRSDITSPASPFKAILDRQGYQGYHGVPRMPVFAYKAIHDEFTDVQDSDVLVERWCGIGVDVLYQRNEVGGHIAEITNGRARALDWLKGVFDGNDARNACVVENVMVNITSSLA